jgi:uncharacterized membrane protein
MLSKWRWILAQVTRRLWLRASLFALLGVAAALVGIWGRRWLPPDLGDLIGARAVDGILDILASSMLAVTTFSLSVMVAAYSAATSNVTPRATRLLMQDRSTQNALAAFIGSFLFSLVGIVTLQTGLYGDRGRVVLFAATLLVILLVVVTILRWVDHLSRLGRVNETTDRVEEAAAQALEAWRRHPCLGAAPLDPAAAPPAGARLVWGDSVGYVQHLDVGALAETAKRHKAVIGVLAPPGSFIHARRPLAWYLGAGDAGPAAVRRAFTLGRERSFDQDPRFCLAVLSEIASRALSPAINDPGTAIDVIGRGVRLLSSWLAPPDVRAEPADGVRLPPLRTADLFDDLFQPIARDGAAMLEVGVRLQKALAALAALGDGEATQAAGRLAGLALARAEAALALEQDRQALRDLVATLQPESP